MATSTNFEDNLVTFQPASGVDLTGELWKLVKLNADGTVSLATADTDEVIGVIGEAGRGNTVVGVCINVATKVKVVAGGTFNSGDRLTAGTSGQAVAWSAPGAGATNHYSLIALEAGASGRVVEALFIGDHAVTG